MGPGGRRRNQQPDVTGATSSKRKRDHDAIVANKLSGVAVDTVISLFEEVNIQEELSVDDLATIQSALAMKHKREEVRET